MKKFLSLIIVFLLVFANVPSFADELMVAEEYVEKYEDEAEYSSYIVVGGEIVASSNTAEKLYYSEDYPLAPVMRALGYEVLFDSETRIITCVKPDISYGFDIDKCLVWSIKDGEMYDIVLYSNPYIQDGVTYAPYYFFYYILEEPGSHIYDYNSTGNPAYVFYDISQETARINTALNDYIDKFLTMGIKPQEYGVNYNVDFKLTCEDLGLAINGGTEMAANCYIDLNNEFISCNLEYDFSGLYNVFKLIMYKTLDTDEKFSMQTVIDKNTIITKNNLTPYASETGWLTEKLPNGLNFEITEKTFGQILSAYGADALNIKSYAGAVAECFEALIKCINISKEGDTVTVTSSIDETFIKSLIDIVVYNVSGESSDVSKSILEGTKFKIDSITVIEDGIYTKADGTGGGVICVTIPDTGVSFTIEFKLDSTLSDSELPVYHNSAEIPVINE